VTGLLVLTISAEDPLAALANRLGDPPVVDLDGVPYLLRVSTSVPAGEAHVVDPAGLNLELVP
jgi:hypothetical protein